MTSQSQKPDRSRRPRKQEVPAPNSPVPVNTGPILHADDDFMYSELVLVGGAACDWLTLTTFDEKEYIAMQAYTVSADSMRRMPIREATRMQYRGFSGDGWFVGEGRQDGMPHYMMQASGVRAQDCLRYALQFHERGGLVKCTRIDLQCTSSSSFADDLPAIAEAIRSHPAGAFGGRGPRPKVTYFSSEDSQDTLYIGSRKSPRFWRFYNKPVSNELRLRAELEAKGWLSEAIWTELCEAGMFRVKQILGREVSSLPNEIREMTRDVWSAHADLDRTAKPVEDLTKVIATQKWLMECVLPAFERIIHTEAGQEVRAEYLRALGFDGSE